MSQDTRYYCHHCQSNTSVFRVPLLVCGACQSPFVEEVDASRSTTANERLRHNVNRSQRVDNDRSAASVMTDDGDDDYEDIDEDSDSELHPWRQYYSEPDPDEEYHFQPWRNYYRRAAEVPQSQRYPPNPMDEYDIDQYYDEVYDYNSRLPMEELDRLNYGEHHHHHHYHNHGYGPSASMHDVFEQLISMFYGVTSESGEFENPWNALLHDLLQTRDGSVQRVAATAGQIEKLEKRKLEEGDADVEKECIICQEPYGTQTEIIKMPCKHEYHGKCIRQWLGISTTCPMCRSSLPNEEQPPSNTSQHQESGPFSRTFEFESPSRGRTLVDIWVANPNTTSGAHSHYDDIDDDYDENIAAERSNNQESSTSHTGQPRFGICPHGYPQLQNRAPTANSQNQSSHQSNPMDELD